MDLIFNNSVSLKILNSFVTSPKNTRVILSGIDN